VPPPTSTSVRAAPSGAPVLLSSPALVLPSVVVVVVVAVVVVAVVAVLVGAVLVGALPVSLLASPVSLVPAPPASPHPGKRQARTNPDTTRERDIAGI